MSWIGGKGRAVATAALTIWFFAGCGGEGGGGDSSGPQNPVAGPQSLAGQTIAPTGGSTGWTREIRFEPAGNIWTEDQNGTVRGGVYEYTVNGSAAELRLMESGITTTVQLNFSAADSGTYIAGQDQGTFHLRPTQNEPAVPPDPGGAGGGGGQAPSSLDTRILYGTRTFTSTGPVGQTHVYTFSGNTFHDSDPPEESDGSYVYEAAGDRATLTLNYYAPKIFNGDRHEIAMKFSTESSGTFESVYTRRDGTMIQINGTFRME